MIVRKYQCDGCHHTMEVELAADQWNTPPPFCPHCDGIPLGQEFQVNIGGSNQSKAADMALRIASEDYGVADIHSTGYEGDRPKVSYKDASPRGPDSQQSTWQSNAALEAAIAVGRQDRLAGGASGLDVIKAGPDLIALSKKRSARVW